MVRRKYDYHRDITLDYKTTRVRKIIERPKIPITLEFNGTHAPLSAPALSLMDSGSDLNLFPEDWAYALGITDLDSYPAHPILGIGNISITGHDVYGIKLYVGDTTSPINFLTWICFSPEQTVPLLGIDGFFSHFKKVTFIDNCCVELNF